MKFYKANLIVGEAVIPVVAGVFKDVKIPKYSDDDIIVQIEKPLSTKELKKTNLSILFPKSGNTLKYLLDLPGYGPTEVSPVKDFDHDP